MTCEQKSGFPRNLACKRKGILHELLAIPSAAQAIQNDKTANIVHKEFRPCKFAN